MVPLTAGAWNDFEPFWSTLMNGEINRIQLSVEALFGNEVQGIDNFRLSGPAQDLCTAVP